MIYITDIGDDLRGLVIRHYGLSSNEDIAYQMKRVIKYNSNSIAFVRGLDSHVETGHEHIMLRPRHLLWLPYREELNNTYYLYDVQSTCSRGNLLLGDEREKLNYMARNEIDLSHVAAVCHLREMIIHEDPVHGREQTTLDHMVNHAGAVGVATSVMGSSSGYVGQSLKGFSGNLKTLGQLSRDYALSPNLQKANIKPKVKLAYQNMHENYEQIIKRIAQPPDGVHKAHRLYSSRNLLKASAQSRNGVSVLKYHEFERISRNMGYIRMVGHGLVAIDIGMTGLQVWDDLEHNDKKKAAMDIAGLAGGIAGGLAAGYIAGFIFAGPVGWVALVGTVALGVGIGSLGSSFLSYVTGEIWTSTHAPS